MMDRLRAARDTTAHLSAPNWGTGILEYTVKVSAFHWFSSDAIVEVCLLVVAVDFDKVKSGRI